MKDLIPYIVLAFLLTISFGWLFFGDKFRTWMNSVVS